LAHHATTALTVAFLSCTPCGRAWAGGGAYFRRCVDHVPQSSGWE